MYGTALKLLISEIGVLKTNSYIFHDMSMLVISILVFPCLLNLPDLCYN